jgi:hypothetical protein
LGRYFILKQSGGKLNHSLPAVNPTIQRTKKRAMTEIKIHPASYKDPAGFIFLHEERVFRQVNQCYAKQYRQLMESGLYQLLTERKWMVPHTEIDENFTGTPEHYKTLFPQQLPFTSYAYEWSFDMLKDAALLTININKLAVEYGMVLKDATPYNIQFYKGRPVFIDTLSFEFYDPDKPWIAYRQFCEMFLFPLYFEHYLKTDINKILTTYIDGIPVELTARLLPLRSSFSMGVWLHVHLQNTVKKKVTTDTAAAKFDKTKLIHLMQHLESSILSFKSNRNASPGWSNYYKETILSEAYLEAKEKVLRNFTKGLEFLTVLDLGANDGHFSFIMAGEGKQVIAADFDSTCINQLYKQVRKENIANILPLNIDLANPSPAIGFNNQERQPFLQRARSQMVLALALIHHLFFTRNISLQLIASCFSELTLNYLIIEFVPADDEKVKKLVENKSQSYAHYNEQHFETVFSAYYEIMKQQVIAGSNRTLYLMKKKAGS